jgi:hypothetical protein
MLDLLEDNAALVRHVQRTLHERNGPGSIFPDGDFNRQTSAGVILLLGPGPRRSRLSGEPCLILNKRSLKVRQPGDLCFPGGSIAPRIDATLGSLVSLPIGSLGRWPYWTGWKRKNRRAAASLALLWATGLRESLEEMRLNPFGVKFLGPLPPQNLVMFRRRIYPMVAWNLRQKQFYPNWEVAKIICIPLRELLDSTRYGRYRLEIRLPADENPSSPVRDFPCFQFRDHNGAEILWGATFRITVLFMEYIFGFSLPDPDTLPIVEGRLDRTYLSGPNPALP